ncbi:hypothetical protein AB1303_14880 [Saccharolobus solfataricus]|uniref:Uncharacterized protein n=1 Tax=Saccharolobus solfataricus TaxID=2287 RepID=A0A7S9IGA4_SACSO|nr:hypothetical protein [Saccharolobus solfataricus]QPG48605.1 hypothetical protein HFC64_00110 [Saccharolobus solfataricus]
MNSHLSHSKVLPAFRDISLYKPYGLSETVSHGVSSPSKLNWRISRLNSRNLTTSGPMFTLEEEEGESLDLDNSISMEYLSSSLGIGTIELLVFFEFAPEKRISYTACVYQVLDNHVASKKYAHVVKSYNPWSRSYLARLGILTLI